MKKNISVQKFRPILAAALTLASSITACNLGQETKLQEFKKFAELRQESVLVTLPNLQNSLRSAQLPEAKISAIKSTFATETRHDSQRSHLSISLGALSREQCEVARKIYADGWKENLSGVDCAAANGQREFLLDYFLTPVMQATVRHSFVPEKTESSRALTPGERKQYGISSGGEVLISKTAETNCWSTAFEVLRRTSGSSPKYTIHNLLPEEVDLRFMSPQLSKSILKSTQTSDIKNQLSASGVSFGDFVIVRDKKMALETGAKSDIAHVTVLIDEGIVFERVGTDSVFPMRIATLDEALVDYPKASIDVRRLLQDFPDPKTENFSRHVTQSMEGTVYEVTIDLKELNLFKSKSGRYALPAE